MMTKNTFSLVAIIGIMWMSHLLVDFMIGIWAVYKTIAGLDLALSGLIAGGAALIGESLQGYFGPLTDKGYRQRLVIFGMALTLASAFMAYTENYLVLFVLFLLTCIGSGAFHPSAVSVINEQSEKRKALAMTIFQSGGSLGLAFSQLIFSQAYFFLEGHTFFLAIPAILLMGVIVYNGYCAQSHMVKHSSKKEASWSLFAKCFRSFELRGLYITQVCNQAVLWATVFLLPDILVSRGYDDWLCFGGGHLFLIMGGAIMMIPAGYLADKYSCKRVIITSFVCGSIGFYFFLTNPLLSPLFLCLLLFFLGAVLGTVSPVVVALGNRLCPTAPGMISAFLMGLVWCVAEGVGQGGGGLLTKLFEENAAASALGCLGLLFIVGLVTASRLPAVEKPLEALA